MVNTITLNERVTLPDDVRTIELQISRNRLRVVLDNLHTPGYDPAVVSMPWEQATDVEFLAAQFDTEAVRTFRVLVTMLARANQNKHIYEALT